MIASKLSALFVVLLALSSRAHGYEYIDSYSGLEEHRRQQSERRSWESDDAGFHLDEEQSRHAYRQIRAEFTEDRRQARETRTEDARQRNLERKQQREQQTALRAPELLEAIASGAVAWPTAFKAPWAVECLVEVTDVIGQSKTLSPHDRHRLKLLASTLRRGLQEDPTCGTHLERCRAMEVVLVLEHLATKGTAFEPVAIRTDANTATSDRSL